MGPTPLDVRKQEFHRSLRGYDPDEVRVFLGLVAGEMEGLRQEHDALGREAAAMRSKLEEYQALERSLRDAMVAAQGVRDDARRQAEREGELILAKANLEAESRLRMSEVRLADLRRELAELAGERQNYLIRLRALIETHMRMVEASEARFEAVAAAGVPRPQEHRPAPMDGPGPRV